MRFSYRPDMPPRPVPVHSGCTRYTEVLPFRNGTDEEVREYLDWAEFQAGLLADPEHAGPRPAEPGRRAG